MRKEAPLANPAPMEGDGSYNARSAVQASGASPALPHLEEAAGAVAIPAGAGAVVVADYGASQGRNSLAPMAIAVMTLRRRIGPDRAVSVVHTDLPNNDFSALFELLDTDPASYLRRDHAAYASAVGRTFYEQVLPAGSVTLAWSAWSVQWLSRAPMPIPDHVQVACSGDERVRAAYAARAAEDWQLFLRHRDQELHDGGRLVVIAMAVSDDGDFGYRPVLTAMNDTLQSLVADGVVQADEAARMAIPTVGRSRAEFAAPFATGQSGRLALDRIEVFDAEDAIWRDYLRDGQAAAFGARWAAFSRASVLPTLALGLAEATRAERTEDFIDRMESGMAARLAARPEETRMPLAIIVAAAKK